MLGNYGHYVEETGRAAREKFYYYQVVDHNYVKISHSLVERIIYNERIEPTGERRSSRNVKKVDYKAMHNGSRQHLTLTAMLYQSTWLCLITMKGASKWKS